jgi:hypothetical protein
VVLVYSGMIVDFGQRCFTLSVVALASVSAHANTTSIFDEIIMLDMCGEE